MRVALLTIGDGRDDLLEQTTASLAEALGEAGDLLGAFTGHVHVDDRDHRLGFCGAIRNGWQQLRELDGFDYVFHLEEDWRFTRPLDLAALALLLDVQPDLAQVALRRNAVSPAELAAGGLVEQWPSEYADRSLIVYDRDGLTIDLAWLEHALFFTTNPTLYRRSLIDRPWPTAPNCEARFGEALKADGYRFAFWGDRADAPWVEHTGTQRTGKGY